MARISFTIEHRFEAPPLELWERMVDWAGHGEWIPATRVRVHAGGPGEVDAQFTAWTGVGPLSLEDRMRVARCRFDADDERGHCEVEKLGPLLLGNATFSVAPAGSGAQLLWTEDVTVRVVPQFLAPPVTMISAAVFRRAMRRLARLLSAPR